MQVIQGEEKRALLHRRVGNLKVTLDYLKGET